MEQIEDIKQDTQYLYYRVAEDSTRWDRMTGVELKRRIKTLLADGESFENMVDVISCLRLAQIYYLRTKNKEECAIPFIVTPQGEMLLLFTAKSQIQNDKYKQYAVESTTYPALIKSLTSAIDSVIINPDSQFLPLSVEAVNSMIDMMDTVEDDLDKSMIEGFQKENLPLLMFERFFGRRIECETREGTFIGDAFRYDMEGDRAYLEVDKADGTTVKIFYDEVVSIKDITNEERE